MADGSHKPIEEVAEGEYVLATNVQTGETEPAKVAESTVTPETERELVSVKLAPAEGHKQGKQIETTAGHSFWAAPPGAEPWVEDSAQWTPARNLEVGSWLRTSDGIWAQVSAILAFEGSTEARNLAVSGLHTYYVSDVNPTYWFTTVAWLHIFLINSLNS